MTGTGESDPSTAGTTASAVPFGRTARELAADPTIPGPEALRRVVALDGPAGTGKSSVARGVAAALGWRFVDTGASYRAATLAVQEAGVSLADPSSVAEVVAQARIQLVTDPNAPAVLLNGRDVSDLVRTPEVTAAVSAVSAVPVVRGLLIAVQRDAAGRAGAVVEGRDIATVVAPQASVKVYLDARPEVRAQRRASELHDADLSAAGTSAAEPHDAHAVAEALAARDGSDAKTNKLAPSEGAVHLDTSDLTLDQVIVEIVTLVQADGRSRT